MTLSPRTTRRLLNFSLFGMALWFFGNLYEEVILMPNWLAAPLDVLRVYNRYYTVVIQYHYYVPVTQLAALVPLGLLLTKNPARQVARADLRRAAIWGLAATALTAWIVLSLNLDLFIGELRLTEEEAHRKGLIWMIGNGIRLAFVGMAAGAVLGARDRLVASQTV